MWPRARCLPAFLASLLLVGCGPAHYRRSADREVYGILSDGQMQSLGKTNAFTIDTPYSQRKPDDIKSLEIIQERLMGGKQKIGLEQALLMAVESNRGYQTRKEQLYLAGLSLTRERYEFGPKFFGEGTASGLRDSNRERSGRIQSQLGVSQLLRTGGSLGASLANDILRFYTGNPRPSATTVMTVNLTQPLLRGAGARIVAENLKQAERNVIYEIRSFSHFQKSFAVDNVTAYLRLLQQKDTVRNEYNNYRNLVLARERAEALSVDRLPAFQADQARQDELKAKSRYIVVVDGYRTSLDRFKITLGLPLGVDVTLDDGTLNDFSNFGLPAIELNELDGIRIAVENRLDLLNEIDRFEDSKRKIHVAANQFKPGLDIFADYSLASNGPTDYTRFNSVNSRGDVGLQLNLPFDRLRERNAFRSTLIAFERELRTLAQLLDDTRNEITQGLRLLEQARQNYQIQKLSVELAEKRVDSANDLLRAGRAQIRDLLEAQSALVTARNAVTQVVVDYHVARLGLLLDIGSLDIDGEKFWVREQRIPGAGETTAKAPLPAVGAEVIPPDQLFGTP
jgi:outer membrane protein TolC